MSNLEAHRHPPTEIVAHPLSNLFILPALWFFLDASLFYFLFIGPCAAPSTNLLVVFLSFILVGASWRSSDALINFVLHVKRWWVHFLFYFIYYLFNFFLLHAK